MKVISAISFLALILTLSFPAAAQSPEANDSLQNDVSPPVGALVLRAAAVRPQKLRQAPEMLRPKLEQLAGAAGGSALLRSATVQSATASALSLTMGPNILGVGVGFPNYFVPDAPTDVNLAVGDTQVVQWVNVSYAVFDKVSGRVIAGPIDGNALWSGFGGASCDLRFPAGAACRCEFHNDGDIIVQWDKLAHRWILTQNVFTLPFLSCVAISTTADATGSFYRYVFPQLAGLPDYPKLGLQADAWYQSQNAFSGQPIGGRYLGAHACAYDRANMLAGRKAKQICFTTGIFDDSLLPADLDSANAPAPRQAARDGDDDDGDGRHPQAEVFLGSIDNFDPTNSNTIYQYLFHADFRHPGKSTFAGAGGTMPITVAPFGLACGGFGSCVQQRDVFDLLDSLGDRLMYRLSYRNFGGYQSWVVNHSVTSGNAVGERWYEFRSPASSPALSLYQQGTFDSGDGNFRWMGSIAQDKMGNLALGYSLSGAGVYPSIYITGRTKADASGAMAPEVLIANGGGSQVDTVSRWGDYTSMALDGADECTFWYTNQYYTVTDAFSWSTRLAAFRFSNCH